MKIEILKSKLKRVYVTEADEGNEGSITIDSDLMDMAGIVEWERVDINGAKKRINTYVLRGKAGTGIIGLNGNAAKCFKVGEKVHILSYCSMTRIRALFYKPIIIETDENNRINHTDSLFQYAAG